jgi:molybdenum cofactor cytidylyltransferase
MTTRIFVGQMALAPAHLVWQNGVSLFEPLHELLAQHQHVLVAGSLSVEEYKVSGLPIGLVDRIASDPFVDAVIVEADGSRRLPFKAPAEYEPVVSNSTTIVVPMVGMDVCGHPLTAEYVHRPNLVAGLAGAAFRDPVTPAMIATVLAHPDGGGKGAPTGARLVPFLNKVEETPSLLKARETARLLLAHPRVDCVVIGAAQRADPVCEIWGRVGAVILAAGGASRFGALKQVMFWGGKPLVAHVADQALSCPDISRVAVTVGAGAEEVRQALASRDVLAVPVPDWADGQSRSVQAGLRAIVDDFWNESGTEPAARWGEGLGAVLFMLADQPGVTPELLSALIRRHRETLAPVVAPRYRGRRGNPVLFDRSTFDEFSSLQGDAGARPILQARSDQVAWVDWTTPEVIQDIDTTDDYRPPLVVA